MSVQLIFDPTKVASLQCPFTFLIKTTSAKGVGYSYEEYSDESIQCNYGKEYDENALKVLALLTQVELKFEKNKYKSHYRKLNLKSGIEGYAKKYVSEYYLKSFRQIFNILAANQRLYHKIQIEENRYANLGCSFDKVQIPELSFKIKREGKKLSIVSLFRLGEDVYSEGEISRFGFLICIKDRYCMLKKPDWQLLEDIADAGTFSHQTYLDKYHKKLEKYPLDLDGVFEQETRETTPNAKLQISELGGDILLFLPSWDYDGVTVEGSKATFTIYQGERQITYIRDTKVEQQSLELLQNAHPNFKDQNSFYLKFDEASKKNWFF